MLRRSAADTVVAAPGTFPFDDIVKAYPALRNLIWVVDDGSAHMDWNEVPEGMGGSVNVATWREIIDETPVDIGRELPEDGGEPNDIVTFWQGKPGSMEEMVRFTQGNIVAGMAGVLGSVPANQRMGPKDVLLPADSLTNIYTLVVTLTGLYCNATVAFNSVAGTSTDLVLATQGISPTVIVASSDSLARVHAESSAKLGSPLLAVAHRSQLRTLARGAFPKPNSIAAGLVGAARPDLGTGPSQLRLVYVAERANGESAPLSSAQLADLRVLLGARISYALTAARVAGAVAQTWTFDYRVKGEGKYSHFGPPTVSAEVIIRDSGKYKVTDEKVEGEVSYYLVPAHDLMGMLTRGRLWRGDLVLRVVRRRLGSWGRLIRMTTRWRMCEEGLLYRGRDASRSVSISPTRPLLLAFDTPIAMRIVRFPFEGMNKNSSELMRPLSPLASWWPDQGSDEGKVSMAYAVPLHAAERDAGARRLWTGTRWAPLHFPAPLGSDGVGCVFEVL